MVLVVSVSSSSSISVQVVHACSACTPRHVHTHTTSVLVNPCAMAIVVTSVRLKISVFSVILAGPSCEQDTNNCNLSEFLR